MTKLSIREASEKFGLSRARLYDLLARNIIAGFRSLERGRKASSWIDAESLKKHINTRDKKQRTAPLIKGGNDDMYVPVRIAVKETGYSDGHIYRLALQGSISAKRPKKRNGWLVCLKDLKQLKKM